MRPNFKAFKRFQLIFICHLISIPSFAQMLVTSSDLPIIEIFTNGNTIVDEPKVGAEIGIINNGPGEINNIGDEYEYFGKIAIEIRGSSSQDLFPKKQYGFELRNEFDEDMDTSLLGMPPEEDWILFAPYNDKTLMRDVLAYKLGNDMGHYAVRTRYCELFINGDYDGIYVLMEKIKRDKNRLDIAKLNPDENAGEDLTGGYIIKIDKSTGNGGGGWPSIHPPNPRTGNQQVFFMYEYPKESEITGEQKNYIQGYVSEFESTLKSENFRDAQSGYRKLIDVPSFIDFMLINELTKNVDGYRLSTFLHKQKITDGGKLHMGPIWDFNLGFGNADYCTNGNPEGFVLDFNEICPYDWWLIPFWWKRMQQDYRFNNEVRTRWDELRNGSFRTDVILNYIDSVTSALNNGAVERNFERWPVLGEWIWPNYYVGATYEEEVEWLKNWVTQRLVWLDDNLPEYIEILGIEDETSIFSVYPNPFENRFTIYFTMDTPASPVRYKLINTMGQVVIEQEKSFSEGTRKWEITNHLSPGVYFLELELKHQKSTFKLIKE